MEKKLEALRVKVEAAKAASMFHKPALIEDAAGLMVELFADLIAQAKKPAAPAKAKGVGRG